MPSSKRTNNDANKKGKKHGRESVKVPVSKSKSKFVEGPNPSREISQTSASTSDDGLAEALLQKLQSGLEKKQKEKETRCLALHKEELLEIQMRNRKEGRECCDEIEKSYASFILEYAKLEDYIRALWVKTAKIFEPYIDQMKEQINLGEQTEKVKEKEHMRGLAYHTKADEDFHKLIAAISEDFDLLNK